MNKSIDISNVILQTERLILRPWTLEDVDDMYEYAKVEGVGIWAGWLPHENREESQRIVESFIKHKKVLAIEYEGKVIGSLGIECYKESDYPELDNLQARELGFVLSKNYWGKGIMTEAANEVIRYLFEDELLDAITCCHYVKNNRSARVQEKCGFEYVRNSINETLFGEKRDTKCNILTREKYLRMKTNIEGKVKIYDISQEVFSCTVFPGDPQPIRTVVSSMEDGSLYNLTSLNMCAHNGTHVDAPYHFINDGKTIDELDLHKLVGPCYVYAKVGELSSGEAEKVYNEAKSIDEECAKRLLFKGKTTVTEEAAKIFASHNVELIGNESQTVGPENAPMKVHQILLAKEVVLLEGVRLDKVPAGRYILNAAPIDLGGSDGAPCRAILIKM